MVKLSEIETSPDVIQKFKDQGFNDELAVLLCQISTFSLQNDANDFLSQFNFQYEVASCNVIKKDYSSPSESVSPKKLQPLFSTILRRHISVCLWAMVSHQDYSGDPEYGNFSDKLKVVFSNILEIKDVIGEDQFNSIMRSLDTINIAYDRVAQDRIFDTISKDVLVFFANAFPESRDIFFSYISTFFLFTPQYISEYKDEIQSFLKSFSDHKLELGDETLQLGGQYKLVTDKTIELVNSPQAIKEIQQSSAVVAKKIISRVDGREALIISPLQAMEAVEVRDKTHERLLKEQQRRRILKDSIKQAKDSTAEPSDLTLEEIEKISAELESGHDKKKQKSKKQKKKPELKTSEQLTTIVVEQEVSKVSLDSLMMDSVHPIALQSSLSQDALVRPTVNTAIPSNHLPKLASNFHNKLTDTKLTDDKEQKKMQETITELANKLEGLEKLSNISAQEKDQELQRLQFEIAARDEEIETLKSRSLQHFQTTNDKVLWAEQMEISFQNLNQQLQNLQQENTTLRQHNMAFAQENIVLKQMLGMVESPALDVRQARIDQQFRSDNNLNLNK